MNILIIDDEKDCCDALEDFIKMLPDCKVYKAYSGIKGLPIIKNNEIDIIFSDIDMPELNGIELMNLIKAGNYDTEIILISGKEDIIKSINAIELGIYDFLIKPLEINIVKKIIEEIKLKEIIKEDINKCDIKNINKFKDLEKININDLKLKNISLSSSFYRFYLSKKMEKLYKKLDKLQSYQDIPVLIEGETGVGKEIAARYIHDNSERKSFPFIGVNCAAVNKEIFESEFFGYDKGSFTGAKENGREGYIKASEKGTLFLDEVSEIPLNLQSKLLRVLEENEYYKVGGTKKEKVNSRILFATNKNLENLAEKGLFREDLLYRINVCRISIPPLRNRKEEIIPLVIHFIDEMNNKLKNKIIKIEAGLLKELYNYDWPGNIRELKNVITSLVIFNEEPVLRLETLNLKEKMCSIKKNNFVISIDDFDLPDRSFDIEKLVNNIVKKTLKKFNGNKSKTARFLNLTRIQLYKRYRVFI